MAIVYAIACGKHAANYRVYIDKSQWDFQTSKWSLTRCLVTSILVSFNALAERCYTATFTSLIPPSPKRSLSLLFLSRSSQNWFLPFLALNLLFFRIFFAGSSWKWHINWLRLNVSESIKVRKISPSKQNFLEIL